MSARYSVIGGSVVFGLPLSGPELLKPLKFLKCWELKDVFCYVKEVTFGKLLRMGAGCQGTSPCDSGLELSVSSPDLQRGPGD